MWVHCEIHFLHFSLCSFLWRYIVNQTNTADILLCGHGAVGFLPTCCGLVGWGFYCIFALGNYCKMVMRRIEMVVVWRRLYLIFAFGNYRILWQVQCGQHLFTPPFSKRTYYKPKPSFQSNKPFAGQKMVLGWYKDGPQRSTNGPQVVVKWVFAELLCLSNSNLTSSWDVVWFCRMRRHNQGGTNASLHNCIRHHLKRMPTPGTILVIRPDLKVSNFHQKKLFQSLHFLLWLWHEQTWQGVWQH